MSSVVGFRPERSASRYGVTVRSDGLDGIEGSAVEVRGGGSVSEPVRSVDHIQFSHRGRPIGRMDCWLGNGEEFGFAGLLPVVGLPRSFDVALELVGNRDDGETVGALLGTITGTRRWLSADYEPRYSPVLVTSLGRSGSTLLMSLLAGLDAVAVPRLHPFELREATYLARNFALMASPANHSLGSTPEDVAAAGSVFRIGADPHFHSRPWRELFDDKMRSHLVLRRAEYAKEAALRMTDEFYSAVHPEAGGGAPYFAEKATVGVLPDLFDELYDGRARYIFLVRDFRDVICSIQSFNRKRGRRDWDETDDASRWMMLMRSAIDALVSAHEERPNALTVRYEDLVTDPGSVVSDVRRWLGVRPSTGERAVIDDSTVGAGHRTTAVGESVGRWQTDLDSELKAAADEYLGEHLEYFGYAR